MDATLSRTDRALIGAIGAARRWSRTPDRSGATAPARAAFASKFEREVRDEFPSATDEQVATMAECRRREFYLRLAAKSVASRKRKAARG